MLTDPESNKPLRLFGEKGHVMQIVIETGATLKCLNEYGSHLEQVKQLSIQVKERAQVEMSTPDMSMIREINKTLPFVEFVIDAYYRNVMSKRSLSYAFSKVTLESRLWLIKGMYDLNSIRETIA